MTTKTIQDIFQRISEQTDMEIMLDSNLEENRKTLTVREAIAIANELHTIEYDGCHIRDIFYDCTLRRKIRYDIEDGNNVIDFWRSRLFVDKIKGKNLSKWSNEVAHLLADPDRLVQPNELSIISTLPRFHEYTQRYLRYANEFSTVSTTGKKLRVEHIRVEYVDTWQEINAVQGRRNIFAFRTHSNKLLLVSLRTPASHITVSALTQLLKYTNVLYLSGVLYHKYLDEDKYALSFDVLTDIKTDEDDTIKRRR